MFSEVYFIVTYLVSVNVRLHWQPDITYMYESVTLLIYKLTNKLNRVE